MRKAHAWWLPALVVGSLSADLTAQDGEDRRRRGGRNVQPANVAAQVPQELPETVKIRIGTDGFVLPAGHIALQELVDRAADYLDWNIYVEKYAKLTLDSPDGIVRMQNPLALDALGCEELLSSLLYMREMALVTVDRDKKVYEVIHLQGQRARTAMQEATRRSPEEVLSRPNLKVPVMTEVHLERIQAERARNALRPFCVGSSHIGQVDIATAGSDSTVILRGFQHQVAQVIQLLRAADASESEISGPVSARIDHLEQTIVNLRAAVNKLRQ